MLYRLLRAAADVALHWYYADVVVQGTARVPARGALLIAANHPNALVDALVVTTALRRSVRLTAKATLFDHPLLVPLLRAVDVVPLRRAADERAACGGIVDARRNTASFEAVIEALRRGGAVLVFPEGISHDEPALAPLKTGTARMALAAAEAGVRGVRVLPVGLVYEAKERPRSRILVRVGAPLDVDDWRPQTGSSDAATLTAELDGALRQVTLNFASEARAQRAVALAHTLAAIVESPGPLGQPRALVTEADLARRIDAATDALVHASPAVVWQADAFIERVAALEAHLEARHVALDDVRISPRLRHGARFAIREVALMTLALPIALVGRMSHWLPLRLARALAMRTRDPSRDQPAMRTIVLGLGFVLVWYAVLGGVLTRRVGAVAALLGLVAILAAAHVDFRLRDRVRRAWRRARTYLALRADPAFRVRVLDEIQRLLDDALALERALLGEPVPPVDRSAGIVGPGRGQ